MSKSLEQKLLDYEKQMQKIKGEQKKLIKSKRQKRKK